MDYNLEHICQKTVEIAKQAGAYLLSEIVKIEPSQIEEKGLHNFVSYVDKTAEQLIISELLKITPDAGFIAEEATVASEIKPLRWIIDPLDGTTNFLHKIPLYCVSIALMLENELIVGVIYEPNSKECYWAWKDGGAYLNGKKICVSSEKNKSRALLATGFPYYDYGRMTAYMELFKQFALTTSGIRRLGTAAMDLAWTACGRVEGFYEYGLQPWDVAAGALLVKEAGGIVTDFQGGDGFIFNGEMLATNIFLHSELLVDVNSYFHPSKE